MKPRAFADRPGQLIALGQSTHDARISDLYLYLNDSDVLLATVQGMQEGSSFNIRLDAANHTPQMPLLANQSGCSACHAIDRRVVGPAWADVAAFYQDQENAKEQLIEKVKNGGKGNWDDLTGGVPMPPYSPRINDENIATLVDFILSLNSADPSELSPSN